MKTAFTIEQQESRKKDEKETQAPGSDGRPSPHFKSPVSKAKVVEMNLRPYQFRPGQSGNPGGVPKYDVAAELARAIIEGNRELIYKAFVKALSKGNAYCFQVLSDSGYSRLRETVRHECGPVEDVPQADLERHIEELQAKPIASLRQQGYTVERPPQLLPPADDSKPN